MIRTSDVNVVFLARVDGDLSVQGAGRSACSGLLAFLCRTKTTDRRDPRLLGESALVVLTMLFLSERSWKHHYVTLLLPYTLSGLRVLLEPARARAAGRSWSVPGRCRFRSWRRPQPTWGGCSPKARVTRSPRAMDHSSGRGHTLRRWLPGGSGLGVWNRARPHRPRLPDRRFLGLISCPRPDSRPIVAS